MVPQCAPELHFEGRRRGRRRGRGSAEPRGPPGASDRQPGVRWVLPFANLLGRSRGFASGGDRPPI
eukprot:8416891-Alexandrium_andersonii.AAC.1